MNIEIGQVITQIISFLIMLWVLKRYAWKPIFEVLEERKNKIQSDFNSIEEQKTEVGKLKEEYAGKLLEIESLTHAKIQDGIKRGKEIAFEIQNEAQEKAKSMLNKAQDDLQREIYKAKDQLKNEMVEMVVSATEKVLQKNVDREAQKGLAKELIEEMRPK